MGFGVPSANIATIANPTDIATAIAGSALPQNTATAVQQTGTKTVDEQGNATQIGLGPIAVGASVTILNQVNVQAFNSMIMNIFTRRICEVQITWFDATGVFPLYQKTWETWAMAAASNTLITILDNHYGQLVTVVLKNIDSTSTPQDLYNINVFQSNRVLQGEMVGNVNPGSNTASSPDGYLIDDNQTLAAGATSPLTVAGLVSGAISYELSVDHNTQLLFQWGVNGFHHAVPITAAQGFLNGVLYGPRRPFIYQLKNVDSAAGTQRLNLHQSPRNF